jgi:hypothetical protein
VVTEGAIILSACRQIFHCKYKPGAELSALFEGVSLALQWCSLPTIIETDCLEIVKILENEEMDWSADSSIIEEIKTLLKVRLTCITHVNR